MLLIPVLLAPFAFRRGLLFALPLMFLGFGLPSTGAHAEGWRDLVQTPDQQGQSAFDSGDFTAAASAFASPDHKAAAHYRAGDFDAAAQLCAALPDQDAGQADSYNLGNALAQSGKFEEALTAYDKVLAKTPGDEDAQFNRDLVAKLLEQQKQDQQQQDQKQDQSQSQDGQKQSGGGSGQQDEKQAGQQDQSGQSQPDMAGAAESGNQEADQSGEAANKPDGQPGRTQPEPGALPDDAAGADQTKSGRPGETKPATEKADSSASGAPRTQANAPDQTPGADAQAAENADAQQTELKDRLDQALAGGGTPEGQSDQEAIAKGTGRPLDQAAEQQLRAVA